MLAILKGHHFGFVLLVSANLVFSAVVHAQAASETNRPIGEGGNVAAPSIKLMATNGQSKVEIPSIVPFTAPSLTLNQAEKTTPSPAAPPQTLSEVKQRLVRALDAKDYAAALEYATIGLAENPENLQLMKAKALALTKLHRLRNAIAAYKEALVVEPNDPDMVYSLAELLLITGQVSEYRNFEFQHQQQIDTAYGGALSKYFNFLALYQTTDENQLRAAADTLLTALPTEKRLPLGDWEFDELLYATGRQPRSEKKAVLMAVVRALMGDISRDDALKLIKSR